MKATRFVVGAAAVLALPAVCLGQVTWSDGFETYTNGSGIIGQGGWNNWACGGSSSTAIVTNEIAAHGGSQSLRISGTVIDDDIIHLYNYTSGVHRFTTWNFLPGDAAGGLPYFILLNTFGCGGTGANWSCQLGMDVDGGVIFSDFEGNELPILLGQWVEISVLIDLDGDGQEIFYGGQLLSSKSWSEGVSGGGLTELQATDLYANNCPFHVYFDDMSIATVPAIGACCLLDGTCVESQSPAECDALAGSYNRSYQGHGSSCAGSDCPTYGQCGWVTAAPLTWADETTDENDDCDVEQTGSPDVLFEVAIPFDARWVFSVCDAQFDSVIFVGETCCTIGGGGTWYNDDGPGCGVGSELTIDIPAGTYYVCVEGVSEFDVGDFVLNIYPTCADGPYAYACDPGSTPEGEPTCGPEYVDNYNGGCNSDPPIWSAIACGDTICGEAGVFSAGGGTSRDTDWYEFTLTSASEITYSGTAEFDMQMLIIQPGGPTQPARCDDLVITHSAFPAGCVPGGDSITDNLAAGDWWLWAGPDGQFIATCGDNYEISLVCGGTPCPEDVNGDGVVNITDLLAVLAAWGPCAGCPEDINGDGVVNITDLLAVLAAWGPCP